MDTTPSAPVTMVSAPNEQHLLFLFLPIVAGKHAEAATALSGAVAAMSNAAPDAAAADPGPDLRAATGVHFSMFHFVPAGAAEQLLPVPTFQPAPGKALLVAIAIYDADFGPYIQAFVDQDPIAQGLNFLLSVMDETGIVTPDDPTSAAFILANGKVQQNAAAFYCLLMRYNFADPTIPGTTVQPPGALAQRYIFGATFPGLTVGNMLQNYPGAQTLWPWPPPPQIQFEPSTPPQCPP